MDCLFVFADFFIDFLSSCWAFQSVLQRALTQSLSGVVGMHAQPHLHPVINNPLAFPASVQPQIFSINEKSANPRSFPVPVHLLS